MTRRFWAIVMAAGLNLSLCHAANAAGNTTGTAAGTPALTRSRHISTQQGLPCNQVFDITQDADGYIWMATANGLCRYDGYQFQNIYRIGPPQSALHAVLGYVFPDHDGRHLWLQTSTFMFACYDLRTGQFVDYTSRGDEERTYRKYLRSPHGTLWMYDDESGVRRVRTGVDGTISCTDYTAATHALADNHVCDAFEDEEGALWVMTLKGLTVIDTLGHARIISTDYSYRKGINIGQRRLILTDRNEILTYDKGGRLLRRTPVSPQAGKIPVATASFTWHGRWMLMTKGATFMVDPKDGSVSRSDTYYVPNGTVMQSFGGTHFISNASGALWMFPAEGDMRYMDLMSGMQLTAERFRRYNIALGPDGRYYIASYGNGLFVCNSRGDVVQHYSSTERRPLQNNNFLNNIMIDRSGCLWMSEESTGVTCVLPPQRIQADYLCPQPAHGSDWSNYVRMLMQEPDGNVTFSTKDNHLYSLQPSQGHITPIGVLPQTAYVRRYDRQGHLWMGTRGAGLFRDGQPVTSLPARHIYDMVEDARGRLWIATWGEGLFVASPQSDGTLSYRRLMKRSFNESILRYLKADGKGRLWIASNNGVYTIDMAQPEPTDDDLQCFNTQNDRLPFDEIISLCCSRSGHLWVGSRGGGLLECRYDGSQLAIQRTLTMTDGMPTNNVFSITEDKEGNIWAGTDNGLTCIGSDHKVSTYQFGHTIEENIYSENCGIQLADGRLLFGTANGLMTLTDIRGTASDGTRYEKKCSPLVTAISVNGHRRYLSGNDHELVLSHDQNSLVLGFSCLDYAGLGSTQYQFYMEGVDHTWLPLTSEHQAYYNALPPGCYRFNLRALGDDNQWGEEQVFSIRIRQPWYNTWWAWLIWLALAAALGFYLYRTWRRNFELNQQMKVELELTDFRLSFFTHIAHEFRTPLAIIQGAADQLADTKGDQPPSRTSIQMVRRGTKRLGKLINQLMEFRKINTGNMKLNVEPTDIVALLRNTYQEFWGMAKQRNQQLTFHTPERQHEVMVDRHLVETIVYNLLSNAVKYTPDGGTIRLRLTLPATSSAPQASHIQISCEDNGPGIADEQNRELFKPFMHGYASQGGMGIGLYTAHQMALTHKGTLDYSRSSEGGACFTLTLPANESVYEASDYRNRSAVADAPSPDTHRPTANSPHLSIDSAIMELAPQAYNDRLVVIVEDDPDMLEQVRQCVGTYFRTEGCTNGKSAMEAIRTQRPALVVCDVMLPDTNGYDIVKQIRADEQTRHLPVIMLTALDDEANLLRGYKAGADDYMVKPCSFELLILRIIQLIRWYDQLGGANPDVRGTEHGATRDENTSAPIITAEADTRFVEKMEHIIYQHIGDPDFNIDQLAAALRMGRTKFYGKTKELTGLSPNNYLQNIRLQRAAELLVEGDLNVTEVSYQVGFFNPSYFYKCFKEKYGVAPSKYGKRGANTGQPAGSE